jgi:hypothetical protein
MNLVPEIGKHLPYFTEGLIVKGFGRGSKQLGRHHVADYTVNNFLFKR